MSDIEVRLLEASDAAVLQRIAQDVFDGPPFAPLTHEFLTDPRHHLAVAMCAGEVVGFASGVHYVHPDKPPELWINEVGVTPAMQRRGIGRALLDCLAEHAVALGCREAWVLADSDNAVARRFYEALGGEASPAVMYSFDLGD
ncbi:MAG: GNAT family N-acetyltransferase [Pseudomonadota bacterium]